MSTGSAPVRVRTAGVATPGAPGGGGSGLTGTGAMLRLALRRDRILVPAWVLGISGMAYFSAAATVGLYPGLPERVAAVEAVNGSAALVAMYGRIYDPSSLGELSLFKMTAFGAALIGVLMVVLAVRHTRHEEEAGRLELVGSTALGRQAPMAAALLLTGIASGSLGLLTAAGLVLAGLPAGGSLAFGAAWAATGMLFAVVGTLAAQVSISGRGATGLGLMVVAAAYLIRAVGDLAEEGPSWLSWLSPIGWSQQVRAFSGTRWVILALPVLAIAVLVPLAFWMRSRRDLGAGLLADRPGPARGSIGSALGLAARLQRSTFVAWAVAATLLGVVLGSVADSVGGFLDSPGMTEMLAKLGGEQGLIDMFLAAELGIIGSIMAAYGIVATRWLPAEEEAGRAEAVLATGTSRRQWAGAHTLLALLGVAVLMVLIGLAIGLGHAISVGDPEQVLRVGWAAVARIPAAWVMVGLAVAIWGFRPRLAWLAWLLFVAFLVIGEFGVLWDLPAWARDLSPFTHSPVLPGPDPSYLGLPVLLLVAAALVAFGIDRFTRRDVLST